MHHEGKRPAGALLVDRPPGRALMGGLAERRRPGQRQHIEIELTGRVLPAVLRRPFLLRPVLCRPLLGERDDGENEKKTQGNGSGLHRLVDAMTEHLTPHLAPGTKRKFSLVNSSRKLYRRTENNTRTK